MTRGAFAAITRNGTVLLVRSRTTPEYVHHWSLPGGVVEEGESLQSGAKREVIEETGVVCEVEKLIAKVDNVYSDIRVSIFKAKYISGEINIDKMEIAEAQWISFEEALTLPLAYNTKAIIQAL